MKIKLYNHDSTEIENDYHYSGDYIPNLRDVSLVLHYLVGSGTYSQLSKELGKDINVEPDIIEKSLYRIVDEYREMSEEESVENFKNINREKRENKKMKKSLLYNYVVENVSVSKNHFTIWADPDNILRILKVPGVISVNVVNDVRYTVWVDKRHDIDVIVENVKELFNNFV